MKHLFLLPLLLSGSMVLGAVAVSLPTPALAAQAGDDVERAERSGLAAIRLPSGAYRSTNKRDLSKFADALQKMAEADHGRVVKTEVIIWQSSDASQAMKNLPTRLKEAGYTYASKGAFDAEPGHITVFSADGKGKADTLLGMWVETKNDEGSYVLLVWGLCRLDSAEKTSDTPVSEAGSSSDEAGEEPQAPLKAAESTAPEPPAAQPVKTMKPKVGSGKVPADLLGKTWSWTTISGVGYRDTVTNQLAAPSGMSARFTFTPDGRYDFFFYVHQRTYILVSESTSTHQGMVTFHGDGRFTMQPSKGYYKGSTGGRLIDRPMTAEERKPVTYFYEWRTEDGKRQLYIGPSKRSLSRFKPAA